MTSPLGRSPRKKQERSEKKRIRSQSETPERGVEMSKERSRKRKESGLEKEREGENKKGIEGAREETRE